VPLDASGYTSTTTTDRIYLRACGFGPANPGLIALYVLVPGPCDPRRATHVACPQARRRAMLTTAPPATGIWPLVRAPGGVRPDRLSLNPCFGG
jgi:hypothetical protein